MKIFCKYSFKKLCCIIIFMKIIFGCFPRKRIFLQQKMWITVLWNHCTLSKSAYHTFCCYCMHQQLFCLPFLNQIFHESFHLLNAYQSVSPLGMHVLCEPRPHVPWLCELHADCSSIGVIFSFHRHFLRHSGCSTIVIWWSISPTKELCWKKRWPRKKNRLNGLLRLWVWSTSESAIKKDRTAYEYCTYHSIFCVHHKYLPNTANLLAVLFPLYVFRTVCKFMQLQNCAIQSRNYHIGHIFRGK